MREVDVGDFLVLGLLVRELNGGYILDLVLDVRGLVWELYGADLLGKDPDLGSAAFRLRVLALGLQRAGLRTLPFHSRKV